MWRAEDGGMLHQGALMSCGRFVLEDIECSANHGAVLHSLIEGRFVDDAATGAVHHAYATLHESKLRATDQVGGATGHGRMHSDEIYPGQQFRKLQKLDSEALGAFP